MEFLSDSNLPWLSKKVFENTGLDYVLALLSFFAIWGVLIIIKRQIVARLVTLVNSYEGRWYQFLVHLLASIKTTVLVIVAVYISSRRLELAPWLDRTFTHVTSVVVIFQITYLLSRAAGHLVNNFTFGKDGKDPSLISARSNLSAILQFAVWTAGFLFLLSNLGINITTFITGLGIGGIAIALAAQAVLGDVFSSFTIAIDKPFEVGDYIIVDDLRGTIEQIGLKTTRIRSIDGELLVISNSDLTKSRIKNYKRMDRRRVNFKINVPHSTKHEHLKEIPEIIKRSVESNEKTLFDYAALLTIKDSTIEFEVVYFVDSKEFKIYSKTQQNVNLQILAEFQKRGISFGAAPSSIKILNSNP